MKTGLSKVLNLTPNHLTTSTRKKIQDMIEGRSYYPYLVVYATDGDSFIIRFTDDDTNHEETPDDLRNIMTYAKECGADMLYFNPRIEPLKDLPVCVGKGE